MNVVLTGVSRGIGLELCALSLSKGHRVIALARSIRKSERLQSLQNEFSQKLICLEGDVTDSNVLSKVVLTLQESPEIQANGLDVLINNAGIYAKDETEASFLKSFQVNSVAPFLMTKALLPFLKKSQKPRVAQITSKMGSIEDNSSGGSHAYRASKTALNMLNKGIAVENPWLTTIVVHPGWVQTDMGGQNAPTQIKESALGIWKVIEGASVKVSGKFFDFRGEEIPW